MTKVLIDIPEEHGTLYFEVENHAGSRDVCAMASALTNVMVLRCDRKGYEVETYEAGRVRMIIENADPVTCSVATAVQDAFMALAEEYPSQVKMY